MSAKNIREQITKYREEIIKEPLYPYFKRSLIWVHYDSVEHGTSLDDYPKTLSKQLAYRTDILMQLTLSGQVDIHGNLQYINSLYAKYGIVADCVGQTFVRWFKKLPEIRVEMPIAEAQKTIWFERACPLYKKLVERYYTPFVEEVLIFRALAEILPQPIAEAIFDCIWGVIGRRPYYEIRMIRTNREDAWRDEVCYTYYDMYGEMPDQLGIPDAESWEAAAKMLYSEPEPVDYNCYGITDPEGDYGW